MLRGWLWIASCRVPALPGRFGLNNRFWLEQYGGNDNMISRHDKGDVPGPVDKALVRRKDRGTSGEGGRENFRQEARY